MTRRVAVVTDSTAYLPNGVAEKYDVAVVPLLVTLPDRTGAEGTEVTPAEVAVALGERGATVTTSRPTPHVLEQAYREAARSCGAETVVAVHLSAALSGTLDAARVAAERCSDLEVRVIDSRHVAMGLGFAVVAAAEAAAADASADQVVAAARARAARTRTLFYVDSLDHLRRGGRIGAAAALVGTALAVKPILHVDDGAIGLLEKVRTTSKAIARLEDLVVGAAGDGPVDLAVHHLAAEDRAAATVERLRPRVPGLQTLHVSEVGAVIGAHVGPGLLGVVVAPR